MSRVFTVIGFWGEAGEREVVGVIEGVFEVLGGNSTTNYGDGPFAVYVDAIDHDSADSQVQGTREGDDLHEVFADESLSLTDRVRTILYDDAQPESDALLQIKEIVDGQA